MRTLKHYYNSVLTALKWLKRKAVTLFVKYRLGIAGALILIGILIASAVPAKETKTYSELFVGFLPNFFGLAMFGTGAWLCNLDYKANPQQFDE